MELNNLEHNGLYRILVIARGKHGSSLPSAMLLINTSRTDSNSAVYGAPSPPHSMTVSTHSATWIAISWQPPEFSHPHEQLSYRVVHKSGNNFTIVDTRLLWWKFINLLPNTQHIIYIMAIGAKGTSLPSETLVAWTDPALPAFVDVSGLGLCFFCRVSGSVLWFFFSSTATDYSPIGHNFGGWCNDSPLFGPW